MAEKTLKQGGNPLLTAPIPQMMRKISIPVAIGATFNTLYNVVDTIYGGLISDQALAALGLSFPIFFVLIALGIGFSQGNTALIGTALGEGNQKEAQQLSVQGITFGILISIITTIGIVWSAPDLLVFIGANEGSTLAPAIDYIVPLFYGTIFFLTVNMLTAILNATGNTIPSRNFLVGGFFLNLLLNPWFIFGGLGVPAMGISGIAIATVLIQVLGVIYIGWEVSRTDLISWESLRLYSFPSLKFQWEIIKQGFPNAVDLMGVSLGFVLLNFFTAPYGDNAVAALGSGARIEQLFLLPLVGLNVGAIALISQNNGAGQYERVQGAFRTSLRYGIIVMLITTGLAFIFARPIMRLFTDTPEIIDIGVTYTRIRSLGFVFNAIFFMSSSALRGIKQPLLPLIFNVGIRFFGLPWLLIYIFQTQLGFGLDSIWWCSLAALVIAMFFGYGAARQLLPKSESV